MGISFIVSLTGIASLVLSKSSRDGVPVRNHDSSEEAQVNLVNSNRVNREVSARNKRGTEQRDKSTDSDSDIDKPELKEDNEHKSTSREVYRIAIRKGSSEEELKDFYQYIEELKGSGWIAVQTDPSELEDVAYIAILDSLVLGSSESKRIKEAARNALIEALREAYGRT